ncbi:MAG: alanine racemase C-terminal domain-containing protein [bacterium]
MSLKARVMYLKNLRPEDSVSYHRAYVAEKRTEVATISSAIRMATPTRQ